MSKIKVLYNDYVERDYHPTKALEELQAQLCSTISFKTYAAVEDRLNVALDQETEAAFTAGFRTALKLFCEAFNAEGRDHHAGI